jgi:hypothetical protein
VLALLLALAVAAAPGPAGAAPAARSADPLERRREAIAGELVKLGARLQREIEAGDVEAILARVPAGGLRCAERIVPRARVARDLRDPGSWLRATLLGPPGRPPAVPPRSLRAFFAAAREVAVLVSFQRDARAGPVGLPCLEYRARDVAAPQVPLCFESRGGRWWLAESLYPCG